MHHLSIDKNDHHFIICIFFILTPPCPQKWYFCAEFAYLLHKVTKTWGSQRTEESGDRDSTLVSTESSAAAQCDETTLEAQVCCIWLERQKGTVPAAQNNAVLAKSSAKTGVHVLSWVSTVPVHPLLALAICIPWLNGQAVPSFWESAEPDRGSFFFAFP